MYGSLTSLTFDEWVLISNLQETISPCIKISTFLKKLNLIIFLRIDETVDAIP